MVLWSGILFLTGDFQHFGKKTAEESEKRVRSRIICCTESTSRTIEKFFTDIFITSFRKLQNFVRNFLKLYAVGFNFLRRISQFYLLTKYYVALQIILQNSERKVHRPEDNIKFDFKQNLKI